MALAIFKIYALFEWTLAVIEMMHDFHIYFKFYLKIKIDT
jgi:hypothetical protein